MRDVEETLVLSTILVVLVVFLFLRNFRATLVPAVSVPLSLLGTFGGMYLLGFSLDNFSLMALIISTGFVVDNTIVVLENVTRHLEMGETRLQAALQGAQEGRFTVLSMSISLVAVFLPILLMGGIVGRMFHEFAVTLTIAIFMSLMVSLTVTPMMCAYLDLQSPRRMKTGSCASRAASSNAAWISIAAPWPGRSTIPRPSCSSCWSRSCLNVYLLIIIPKGFFPAVDEGRMQGGIRADQSISFQSMQKKFLQFMKIIHADPAVAESVGGGLRGAATQFRQHLRHPEAAGASAAMSPRDDVIERLRPAAQPISPARALSCSRSAPPACAPAAARAMATINIPSRPTRWMI